MPVCEQDVLAELRSLGTASVFYVALSGGLDSTVLLHLLAQCRDRLGARLEAIHVNHGLLPQARAWAAGCRAACDALGVPLRVIEVEAASLRAVLGVEAAARQARYDALAALLEPGDWVLTAHHRDDQVETVLLQLLRGSGPAGLAAMPRVAPLGRGRLARPLLGFDRADLLAYAQAHALRYVDDPSNEDRALGRGFLRAEILPRLRGRWPGLGRTLVRAARHAADAAAIIAERAAEDLERLTRSDAWQIPVAGLAELSVARRRALLRHWCRERGIPTPDTARLDELLGQLAQARAERPLAVTWPGGMLRRYRGALFLAPGMTAHDPGLRLRWDGVAPLALPSGLGTLRLARGGWLRRDLPERGVAIGFRSAGLRCAPAGRGGHRDLKRLFQEAGVPPWLRDRIPLVFVGDELAAVADLWVCAEHAATDPAKGLSVVWERPGHLALRAAGPRGPNGRRGSARRL